MNIQATRALTLVTGALLLFPSAAFAGPPFAAATTTLTSDVMMIITPLAGLAVIVIGLLALFNIIKWIWLGGALIGVGLIFGHQQVIGWFRGLMGV